MIFVVGMMMISVILFCSIKYTHRTLSTGLLHNFKTNFQDTDAKIHEASMDFPHRSFSVNVNKSYLPKNCESCYDHSDTSPERSPNELRQFL